MPRAGIPAEARRIVAVGDLHGDLGATQEALRLAGLIDDSNRWAGGATVLVQTGDILDRGDEGRQIMDLLMALQADATKVGGKVICLLGNHEVMNLQGEMRYVTDGDFAAFGKKEDRVAALRPTGIYGAWLLGNDLVTQVGETVFAHGGITPSMARLGVQGLNRAVGQILDPERSPILGRDGPTWYRGYLEDPNDRACSDLAMALQSLGAVRMVVGHTSQDSGQVAALCGGAILGIDTGISASHGHHVSAIRIEGHDAWALYPGGPVDLPDSP